MNALFLFFLALPAAAAPRGCPPPKTSSSLSRAEMERKFSASTDPCERFSLAYRLHFEGERFQKEWGLKALGQLKSIEDYRSLTIYGLQLHDLLAANDPDRSSFHWLTLSGIQGALESVSLENDQTWIRWALGFENEDPKAASLSFDSFLDQYGDDKRAASVRAWKEAAVTQYLELELRIANAQFRRGDVFAPVVRFEGNLRLAALQTSAQFPRFVWETIRFREQFRASLAQVSDSKLRIWLRLEGREHLDRTKAAKRIRAVNCADYAKVEALGLRFRGQEGIRAFSKLCSKLNPQLR